MPSSTIVALQQVVQSGSRTYPIYMGFLKASEIEAIAEAPAFTMQTSHDTIARNILTPPIRQWQRPLNTVRVQEISNLFNATGEFMPNPVLLCESVPASAAIEIRRQQVGGIQADSFEIVIPLVNGSPKPLWILDGQHRIRGMALSNQSNDPIPLVLLLNHAETFYSGPDLAKIFAQVTTEATRLGELHNEWLTFAFGLRKYNSVVTDDAEEHKRAMTVVAKLCERPQFTSGGVFKPNPFLDRIQFNDFVTPAPPAPGGFDYKCGELAQLFHRHYFTQPSAAPHLSSEQFAEQFLLAHDALRQIVSFPQDQSVFFGAHGFAQKIMQDAFIAGLSAHLLVNGIPQSWEGLLRQLRFDQTSWNFNSWTVSLHGQQGTASKRVATTVLVEAFRTGTLPAGTGNLGDYLKGDRASIELAAYSLRPSGRIDTASLITLSVDGGSVRTLAAAQRRLLKLKTKSSNIARLVVTDKQSPPGRLVDYTAEISSARGLELRSPRITSPLELLITLHYYGGQKREAEVSVQWH